MKHCITNAPLARCVQHSLPDERSRYVFVPPVRKRGCIEAGRLQNSDWNKDFQKNESDTSKKLPNTNVI